MNEQQVVTVHTEPVATVHQTVLQMHSDFVQTGTYKPQDLRMVLGDITASVTVVTPNASASVAIKP